MIVSVCGRALAQSARRGGFRPAVFDAFADSDTLAAAEVCTPVPMSGDSDADDGCEFDVQALMAAAGQHCPPDKGWGLIYGAGFEAAPRVLESLAKGRVLLGNDPDVIRQVKSPETFFELLDDLKIPHPETRLTPPSRSSGWLRKRIGGSGGVHIGAYTEDSSARTQGYYQRFVPGPAMSVLFLADGETARVIGYNRLWTAGADCAVPYAFGGAISDGSLNSALREKLEGFIQSLAHAVGLRGLNSLDFILSRGQPRIIELNPRPSASFELYDPDFAEGLVALHIRACRGELPARLLPEWPEPQSIVRALRVIYAPQAITVPTARDWRQEWPIWCSDRPYPGAHIPTGAPLCTVHAQGRTTSSVCKLLKVRRQAALNRFDRYCRAA